MSPVAFGRTDMLRRLADEHFDVLVVGGGITGAGVALDAASRGLRAAMVDKGDLASGTSSKSSKLVHGGLRYLQQGEITLVYEALAERQRLLKLAPHLVRTLPFLIPILTREGVVPPKVARAIGAAMWGYDLTGGARIGRLHERLTKEEALAHFPTLPADRLASAYLYYDARTDDARLCLAVARTAAAHGAVVANYAEVTGFSKDAHGRVVAATVDADGTAFDVRCQVVVNAGGVWSDEVRTLDEGRDPHSLRPAKGVHLTVPWSKVRTDIAAVIPVPQDRRSLFVVPWGELAYVGTTDTDYDGPLDDPPCTADDVAYVLRALNHSVTSGITEHDVLGTWAGLRPLMRGDADGAAPGSRTADLSRRHAVSRSPGNVVTVTGGKLTTYRRMAVDAADEAAEVVGHRGRSRTKHIPLVGADGFVEPDAGSPVAHLAHRYGTEAADVEALVRGDPVLGEALVPGLPYRRAEAVFAARHEMALTLDDILSRRTRARLLARDDSVAVAAEVAALVARELGWSEAEQARQVEAYAGAVRTERAAAALPETALDARLGA